MIAKLAMTVISGGLATWLGSTFVAPTDLPPVPPAVVAPEHGDSHRLGAIGAELVSLPIGENVVSPGLDPLLGVLVLAD